MPFIVYSNFSLSKNYTTAQYLYITTKYVLDNYVPAAIIIRN